jgi:sn-glycerol 3-phosphate transport system permease protein
MVENAPWLDRLALAVLVAGAVALAAPVLYALWVAATPRDAHELEAAPSIRGLVGNVGAAWSKLDLGRQLFNSLVMALGITLGKLALSVLSAFAIVYFRFPFRMTAFWLIFLTLMLPVEVRIVATYEVAANLLLPIDAMLGLLGLQIGLRWSLLDSYAGLMLPLIASATATFLFRQFFLTVPDDLLEAAKLDAAGPFRFLVRVLLPLSSTTIAALAVILFVYGWNQYLWPLLITTRPEMSTIVMGVAQTLPTEDGNASWSVTMAVALLATLPPVAIVVALQRWFVKGLIDAEK